MATHSSTFAWRILWTEEPGGLQSLGRKESDRTEVKACTHSKYKHKIIESWLLKKKIRDLSASEE